jgi:hypothetical protein
MEARDLNSSGVEAEDKEVSMDLLATGLGEDLSGGAAPRLGFW